MWQGAKKHVAKVYGLDTNEGDPEETQKRVAELLARDNFIYLGDGVEVCQFPPKDPLVGGADIWI